MNPRNGNESSFSPEIWEIAAISNEKLLQQKVLYPEAAIGRTINLENPLPELSPFEYLLKVTLEGTKLRGTMQERKETLEQVEQGPLGFPTLAQDLEGEHKGDKLRTAIIILQLRAFVHRILQQHRNKQNAANKAAKAETTATVTVRRKPRIDARHRKPEVSTESFHELETAYHTAAHRTALLTNTIRILYELESQIPTHILNSLQSNIRQQTAPVALVGIVQEQITGILKKREALFS